MKDQSNKLTGILVDDHLAKPLTWLGEEPVADHHLTVDDDDHLVSLGLAITPSKSGGVQGGHLALITQAALAEFLQLKALAAAYEAAKDRLKAALVANVPVEPGDHTAVLQHREARYLTAPHMIAALALSPEQVAALRASAELKVTKCLLVW